MWSEVVKDVLLVLVGTLSALATKYFDMRTAQSQLRGSKVIEAQWLAMVEVYHLLVRFGQAVAATGDFQPGPDEITKRVDEARLALNELSLKFEDHRLFFDSDVGKLFDSMRTRMREGLYSRFRSENPSGQMTDALATRLEKHADKARQSLDIEFPALKRQIEIAFRRLLGMREAKVAGKLKSALRHTLGSTGGM